MTFLIDENLPPSLVELFHKYGLTAYHVNQLKSSKKHRIVDDQIRRLAIHKKYIILTKDDDFVKSFVDRKVPEKMIFLFNLPTKVEILARMDTVLPGIVSGLQVHDFIEVNDMEIRFPFSSK